MAVVRSTYPQGASATDVSMDPFNTDPLRALQALIAQEATMPRQPAVRRPMAAAAPARRSAGGGTTREWIPTAEDGAAALASRAPDASKHRYTQLAHSGGMGPSGWVERGAGPGAVYAGHWDTADPGVTSIGAREMRTPAFDQSAPQEDPTERAFGINKALGPTLAEKQRRERLEAGVR